MQPDDVVAKTHIGGNPPRCADPCGFLYLCDPSKHCEDQSNKVTVCRAVEKERMRMGEE